MSTRVNKMRIMWKVFDSQGIFMRNRVREFFTTRGAAVALKDDSNRFFGFEENATIQVGNSKGWVTYDIEAQQDLDALIESLEAATDMHLAFYNEGEEAA